MNNRRADDRREGEGACRHWFRSALLAVVLGALAAGCSSSAATRNADNAYEPQSVTEWLGNEQPQW